MHLLYETVMSKLPTLRPNLTGTVVIDGSNVAEYVLQFRDGHIDREDVPNAAPPFDNFWIEIAVDRAEVPTNIKDVPLFVEHRTITGLWFTAKPSTKSGAKWDLACMGFQGDGGQRASFFGIYRMLVDEQGAVISMVFDAPLGMKSEDANTTGALMSGLVWTGLLAVSFMHCKNVEMVEHGPGTRPAGARNRRGPRIKFYTLQIDPMKKVLRTEGHSDTTGLKKALHICRGHFAHYTDEKKLFGKYTGTFWRPMHTRGSVEHGKVIKDYAVNAPTEPTP